MEAGSLCCRRAQTSAYHPRRTPPARVHHQVNPDSRSALSFATKIGATPDAPCREAVARKPIAGIRMFSCHAQTVPDQPYLTALLPCAHLHARPQMFSIRQRAAPRGPAGYAPARSRRRLSSLLGRGTSMSPSRRPEVILLGTDRQCRCRLWNTI